jgi:hypothetical protein
MVENSYDRRGRHEIEDDDSIDGSSLSSSESDKQFNDDYSGTSHYTNLFTLQIYNLH